MSSLALSVQGEMISNPEVHNQPPVDVLAEYGDVVMTYAGHTDTLINLWEKCPMPKDNMSPEAINMFALTVMNKSGAKIREEHVSHAQEVLEARGVEFNMKIVRAEPAEPSAEQALAKVVEVPETHINAATINNTLTLVSERNEYERFVVEGDLTLPKPIDAKPYESHEPLGDKLAQDESVAMMDAWLTQVEAEYEQRYPNMLAEASQPVDSLELVEVEVAAAESSSQLIAADRSGPELKELPNQGQAPEVIVLASDIVSEQTHVPDIDAPINEVVLPPLRLNNTEVYDQDFELVTIAELTQLTEIIEVTNEEGTNEPQPLLAQLSDFVETSDTLSKENAEIASVIIAKIDTLAEQLIVAYENPELQANDLVAIEQALIEACQELLISLGIEYDDVLLKRITSTIIQQKLDALVAPAEVQTALPQDEGTHEHKLFSLQDFVFDLSVALSASHRLGRHAVWAAAA